MGIVYKNGHKNKYFFNSVDISNDREQGRMIQGRYLHAVSVVNFDSELCV